MIAGVGSVTQQGRQSSRPFYHPILPAILPIFTLIFTPATSLSQVGYCSSKHDIHVQHRTKRQEKRSCCASKIYCFHQESKTCPRKPIADFSLVTLGCKAAWGRVSAFSDSVAEVGRKKGFANGCRVGHSTRVQPSFS